MDDRSFSGTEVAIIGLSGRFPKSRNISEYWKNIKNGIECITFFEDEELINAGVEERELKDPNYVKAYGWLEDCEKFDNTFFNYNEREALLMDPQMRLLHEVTWEALEDSGYNPETSKSKIGLYVGASDNLYWQVVSTLGNHSTVSEHFATFQLNNKDFLATQIAYKLNLKGPAVTVSTACSTSLVTVHIACQALLGGECDIALAGGVTISFPSKRGYMYQEGMILSPDGHCRPFDHEAAGIVGGNGAGIVVLKLLEDALEDGDYIHAIIKGSAINNDGNRKVGYSAPSVEGQVDVIRTAHKMAEIDPETISYLETHGTATRLGDSIEIEALKQAFNTSKRNICAIGSVKSNIGHLDIAAGVAGLIKSVLVVKHKIFPPSVNFTKLNSHINFENSPFYINKEIKRWNNEDMPLRVGVSSFGIGGTNAHIVLEEAPTANQSESCSSPQQLEIIPVSADSPEQLERVIVNMKDYVSNNGNINMRDIANTLQIGRKNLTYRNAFVCKDYSDLIKQLNNQIEKSLKVPTEYVGLKNDQVIFMFPGQGAQYAKMGEGLLRLNNIFTVEFDRCLKILKEITDIDFKEMIYSESSKEWIKDTGFVQPFLFSFEYSLARLIMDCGVIPQAMIGHSLGEYVAACLSGVFSLEDALNVIVNRGKLMNSMPSGSMLSVMASYEELKEYLDDRYSIAALNNSNNTVLSAGLEDIDEIDKKLKVMGYVCTKLHTSQAFHSTMTDMIVKEFKKVFENVELKSPQIPFISNVTGTWIFEEEAKNPEYWCKHLRQTVRFGDGLETLLEKDKAVFIEIGPGKTLTSFVNSHEKKHDKHCSMNLIRHIKEDVLDEEYLLKRMGNLWSLGIEIKWQNYFNSAGKRIPLPVYPFNGTGFMIKENPFELIKRSSDKKAIEQKNNINDWFYAPNWKSESIRPYDIDEVKHSKSVYVVFSEENQFGEYLDKYLRDNEVEVITIKKGYCFQVLDSNTYMINPAEEQDYDSLFKTISGCEIKQIIHTWTVMNESCGFDEMQQRGLYSLINIVKAISRCDKIRNVGLTTVSNGLSDVFGDEIIVPDKTTLIGAMRVIPQENPMILSKVIDIKWPRSNDNKIFEQILYETLIGFKDKIVALRGTRRWIQCYENVKIEENFKPENINTGDVFVITGGLGRLGKIFTKHLISKYKAKIAIITRTFVPEKSQWQQWCDKYGTEDKTSKSIAFFRQLEVLDGEFAIYQADIAEEMALRNVINEVENKWGKITGVIHAVARTDTSSIKVSIDDVTMVECKEQLSGKALGVIALEKALEGKSVNYCLLFSSLASVLGGLGYIAYSSANSFLDGYAKKMDRETDTRWISINWDNWNADENENNPLAIETLEGTEVLEVLTQWKESQVLISTYDLQARLERSVELEWLRVVNAESKSIAKSDVVQLNDIEMVLKFIWKDQLGIKDINVNDNFFELGGDSLKALSIIAMIQSLLKKKLKISQFFQKPTIVEIVELLKEDTESIEIQKVIDKQYYKLCSSQERLYILSQMHKDSTGYNLPQIIMINGTIDLEKSRKCFVEIVNRHEALRTSFHYIKGEILQEIHNEVELNFNYIEIEKKDIKKYIDGFVRPFILDKPSLFRVELLKFDTDKHMLMLDCHHIISDGGSFKILFEEFTKLYNDQKLPLSELRYRDYCEWENSEEYIEIIGRQKAFWLEQLSGELPELELPIDFVRKENLNYEGNSIIFEFGVDLTKKINEYVASQNTTKFVFFLTILNILLAKLSNCQDIIIGTPVARRDKMETKNIFGHFLNVLPMRNFPRSDKKFNDFFKEVTENTVSAFENQDYSYKSMVEMLNINWKANRNPLFDVMLVMQNIKGSILEIDGLEINPYSLESKYAKFDLTLEVFEDEQKFTLLTEYCTELFTKSTIEQFIEYFKKITLNVLECKDLIIMDIKLSEQINRMDMLSSSFEF